jgi:cytochrome c-type biogenesis protein CcmE
MSTTRNRWLAIAALAVAAAAFVVITAGGIGENLIYYWGPTELHAAGPKAVGATIRLGGQVRTGSVKVSGVGSALEFDVTDGKNIVHVQSSSVPPQMFREGIGVVVEGTMNSNGTFVSDRLMVSHGNEYRAPEKGEAVNAKELMRTTEGLQE